jgi:hypothetical protein
MWQIEALIAEIEKDLSSRQSGLEKRRQMGLATFISCVLSERETNLMVLSEALPRNIETAEKRYQYLSRFLASERVNVDQVMSCYVPELLSKAAKDSQTVVLMLDQSHIRDGFEVLMVSLRVGERAIPLLWRVVETRGSIGFEVQEDLLNALAKMVPAGIKILLAADRFYGTPAMIQWLECQGWDYRIRLKGNINFQHQGGEINGLDAYRLGIQKLENVLISGKCSVQTNIGIIHDQGHPEPWIIAMSQSPNRYRTLDYSMRWGIEAMFSDFKSRGFGITNTKLIHAERIARLILVLSLAIYWAVSTAMTDDTALPKSKKTTTLQALPIH